MTDPERAGSWPGTLKDRGSLKASISDAGKGLVAGIKAAFPDAYIQIDVFHTLRDLGREVSRFVDKTYVEVGDDYRYKDIVNNRKGKWQKTLDNAQQKLRDLSVSLP